MNAPRSMCACTCPRPARLPIDFTHRWAVEALTFVADQDRSHTPFTDRKVDGSSGAWHERDHCGLVALAENPEGAVAAVEAEVATIRLARLAHPQQEAAEFGAVHPVALTRINLRASHVLGRVRTNPTIDVRACRCEDLEADRRRPREEEAKILPIHLQRSSAVARKESDRSEFRFVHLLLNEYLIEPDPIR